MYFVEKLLECSRNFEKYLMERQLHGKKKFYQGCQPMKSAVLISSKNVVSLKRNQPKYDDAKTKRKKKHKKATSAKRTQTKRAARFNEETTVVVGWRCGYLHDLHAKFAIQLDQELLHRMQLVPKTISFEVCHHDTKLFLMPKLRCQCKFWGGTMIFFTLFHSFFMVILILH